jgi:hypothetical protein
MPQREKGGLINAILKARPIPYKGNIDEKGLAKIIRSAFKLEKTNRPLGMIMVEIGFVKMLSDDAFRAFCNSNGEVICSSKCCDYIIERMKKLNIKISKPKRLKKYGEVEMDIKYGVKINPGMKVPNLLINKKKKT